MRSVVERLFPFRESPHAEQRVAVGIFVIATAFRLWFGLVAHPPSAFLISDMGVYLLRADRLLAGLRDPWDTFTPVGYPAFLAALFSCFGRDLRTVAVAQSLAGGLVCWLVFLIARRMGWHVRALVASALVAAYFPLVFYGALLLSEVMATLLLVGFVWSLIRASDRLAWFGPCAGFFLGLAMVVRPNLFFAAFAVPLYFWVASGRSIRRTLFASIVVGACALPFPALACFRNSVILGRPTGIATNGGLNFFLAHTDVRGARWFDGRFTHAVTPIFNLQHFERDFASPVALYEDAWFYRAGSARFLETPRLAFSSLANLVDGVGLGSQDYWPGWAGHSRWLLAFSRAAFPVLVLPSLLSGLLLLRRFRSLKKRDAEKLLVVLVATSVFLPMYLFLGDPRLRVPHDPLLILAALDLLPRPQRFGRARFS